MNGIGGEAQRRALFIAVLCFVIAAPAVSGAQDEPASSPDPAAADGAEAKQIFRDEQAAELDSLEQSAVALSGERVVEYRGDEVAVVAPTGRGNPIDLTTTDTQPFIDELGSAANPEDGITVDFGGSLVVGSDPLAVADGQGSKDAVNLTLDQRPGGALVPENPLVDLRLGEHADNAVSIESGDVRLGIPKSPGATSPTQRRIDDVGAFYAEVGKDTDLFVAPRPQGAEVYTQIRSGQAPRSTSLAVTSDEGPTDLRPGPSGGVEIWANDRRQALVHAPIAFDANGREVPAMLAISGDEIDLRVEHQSGEFAYPIQVDPLIENYNWAAGSTGLVEWEADAGADARWLLYKNFNGPCSGLAPAGHCFGRGLYAYAKANETFYAGGHAGFYYFPARQNDTSAWAEKAVFSPVRFYRNGDLVGSPQLKVGIFNSSILAPQEIDKETRNDGFVGSLTVDNPSNAAGKQVRFELSTAVSRTTQQIHDAYLGGAQIYLQDGEVPAVTVPTQPAADWVKTTSTSRETVGFVAADRSGFASPGLGIRNLGYALYRPGGAAVTMGSQDDAPTPPVPSCNGSRQSVCPVSHSANASYSTSTGTGRMAEGVNYGFVLAYDALSKAGAQLWWIKIDNSSPVIASRTGELSGGAAAPAPGDDELTVAATDGSAPVDIDDPATRQTARSGVAWMELRVGPASASTLGPEKQVARVGEAGSAAVWTQTPEVGSDAHTYTFQIDCSSIRPGLHTFQVLVGDYVGNQPTTQTWKDTACLTDGIDRDPEKLGLERYFDYDSTEAGLSGFHVNTGTGNAVWHSVPMVNPGRGLSSVVNLTYNSFDYPEIGDIPLDSRFLSLDYDEAGLGFSLGLSGITRINEPLGGVLIPNVIGAAGTPDPADPTKELGAIVLTDPDGTTHVFQPDLDRLSSGSCASGLPTRYVPPPGVNLELRRYSCPTADAQALVAKVLGKLDPRSTDLPLTVSDFLGLELNPTTGEPELWPGDEEQPNKKLNDLRAGIAGIANSSAEAFEALYALEDPRMWAITRPDGVTYFYNGFGFPTQTVDRNGNTLSYEYEKVTPVGQACSAANTGIPVPAGETEPPIIPGLCEPRLIRVKDAAAVDPGVSEASRTITLDYYDLEDIGGPSASSLNLDQPLGDLLADIQSALTVPANLNKLNKVRLITDHVGRSLSFEYDAEGLLAKLTEGGRSGANGGNISRFRNFDYESGVVGGLTHRQLSGISQPTTVGSSPSSSTTLAYDTQSGLLSGRRVDTVTNRAGDTHAYAYAPGSGGAMTTTVTTSRPSKPLDASPPPTKHRISLDAMARPTSIEEAVDSTDQRTTTLSWDGDGGSDGQSDGDNNVVSLTEAAGSSDATEKATTNFSYEPNGRLLTQTDAVGQTSPAHTTTLSYCSHNGTTDGSAFGTDASGAFVVDLKSIKRPRQNMWSYGLDGGSVDQSNCTGVSKGLVTSQRDPAQKVSTATYDGNGLLAESVDAANAKTTYGTYDPNGLPQEIVDPEGHDSDDGGTAAPDGPDSHRWVYRYDSVGNVVSVTDPRAGARADTIDASTPFTTRLTYDGYDRLIKEETPRCSGGTCLLESKYGYDARDNETTFTDAEESVTTTAYNEMDRPLTITDGENQVTGFGYDREQGLTSITSPKGMATPASADFKTMFTLDALGRRVLAIQSSTAEQDLVTSYDYDQRDRLRGIALPADNADVAETDLQTALDRASADATRRFRYDYDTLGNLTTEIENPSGVCSTTQPDIGLKTTYSYDDNDNLESVISPRASCGESGSFTTTFEYDLLDRQTKETNPLQGVTNTGYDPVGRVTSIETPRGTDATSSVSEDHKTTYDYDANGDLLSRSIPWADGQYGIDDESRLAAAEVTYKRNAVGDPIKIFVPRAISGTGGTAAVSETVTVDNDFYETGELKATNRPWWWRLDWSSSQSAPRAGERFSASGSGGIEADTAVPVGGPVLTEGGPLIDGPGGAMPSAGVSGDFGTVSNEQLPDFLPRAGEATFSYDRVGRIETVTATAPEVDREHKLVYDKVGRIKRKVWPYSVVEQGPGPPEVTTIAHHFTYDANGNLATYIDGLGTAPDQAPAGLEAAIGRQLGAEDYTTVFDYDQFDRRTEELAPGSAELGPLATSTLQLTPEQTTYAYDPNGMVKSITTPRGNATPLAGDFSMQFTYDAVDRLKTETNPAQESWTYGYDAESNSLSVTNPRGFKTTQSYDALNRLEQVKEASGQPTQRITDFDLDPEGNVTTATSPGSALTKDGAAIPRVTSLAYDGLGRPWKTTTGTGAASSYNAERTEIVQRDPAGYPVRELRGIGAADTTLSNPSLFDSYAPEDGDLEDQTKHATVHRYSVDGLRTSTYLPHDGDKDLTDGGAGRFKTTFAYDPTGWLSGIDHAYAFTQPTDQCGQAKVADVEKLGCTTRVGYKRYETGWIAASSDSREINPAATSPNVDQDIRYSYDPRGFQTSWQTEAFLESRDDDGGFEVTREAFPAGTMYSREGIKSDESNEPTPSSRRTYTYGYNANRSLTAIRDVLPNFPVLPPGVPGTRVIGIARDAAEREKRVNEDWKGGRDTAYTYDANGNVLTRRVDGKFTGSACEPDGSGANCAYTGGRSSAYSYDARDREESMVQTNADASTETWETTWWPSDELASRTKPNGTYETRFYLPSGEISEKRRDPAFAGENGDEDEEQVTKQTYGYDLNGNRTFDERGRHAYNARSLLIRWDRPAPQPPVGTLPGDVTDYYGGAPASGESYAEPPSADEEIGHTAYTVDGTGQTLRSTAKTRSSLELEIGGVASPVRRTRTSNTTAAYDYRDGLLRRVRTTVSATFTGAAPLPPDPAPLKTTAEYGSYDDLGSVGEIVVDDGENRGDIVGDPAPVTGCGADETRDWTSPRTTYHCYDAFGRLASSQAPHQPNQPKEPAESWIYDGLDRRDTKLTETSGGDVHASDRFYVGTSELVSREAGPATDAASKSYAYDSQGLRLGVTNRDAGSAADAFENYDHDANGSVIGLENANGTFDRASDSGGESDLYRFDPYGSLLDTDPGDSDGDTAEEELTAEASDNPFRFEGFYYDSGIESYDMQAREYRPGVGRFLSQDRFAAAGADVALQSDPLTQNRYAFAGGNPTTSVEWDGHYTCSSTCDGGDKMVGGYGGYKTTLNGSPDPAASNATLNAISPIASSTAKAAAVAAVASVADAPDLVRRAALNYAEDRASDPLLTKDGVLRLYQLAADLQPGKSDVCDWRCPATEAAEALGFSGDALHDGVLGALIALPICRAPVVQRGCSAVGALATRALGGLGSRIAGGARGLAGGSTTQAGAALARAGVGAEGRVSALLGIGRNTGATGVGRAIVRPGSGPGGFRIPDFSPALTIAQRGTVVEVKDVARLSSTPQLRDLLAYSQSQGVPLEIFTNASLPTRGGLKAAYDAGDLLLTPIP